jgi:hypothetical protein
MDYKMKVHVIDIMSFLLKCVAVQPCFSRTEKPQHGKLKGVALC